MGVEHSFVVCLLLVGQATTEHVGKSGAQLSVGIEMEAYGDQAAAASVQFFYKSREKPSRKPCDHQHRAIELMRPERSDLVRQKLNFQDSANYMDMVQ